MHTNSHMLSFTTRQRTITDALPCRDISRPSTLISRVTPLQKHNDAPLNSRKLHFNVGYKQSLLAILAPILLVTQSPEQFPAAAAPAAPNTATSVAGQNVGLLKDSEIDKKRKKAGVKRSYDGHVAILNKYTKTWVDIKCDFQVPGLLLLREEDGQVYWLGYGAVKQIDLSDDMVVQAIATDDWENSLMPVQGTNESGETEPLVLPRDVFYQIVSIVDEKDWRNPAKAGQQSTAGVRRQR